MVEASDLMDLKSARDIKLYFCRKHTGEKLKKIGEHFGMKDAAVSQACKRFQMKLEKDKKIRKTIERFEKSFIC